VCAKRKGADLEQFKQLHYLMPYYQAYVRKAGKSGSLSSAQVAQVLAELSEGGGGTAKLAKRLCNEFDEDESGCIDLDEFMGIAVKIVDEELL
jgi:Ca2+-binding EF-hand superfamily protein